MPTPLHSSLHSPLRSTLLALGLAMACAAAAAQKIDTVAVDAQFDAAAQAGKLVSLSDPGALKGVRRLAIGSFQVEFQRKGVASANSYRIGQSGSAYTSVSVSLTGIENGGLQAIADALYQDYRSSLQAAGWQLVPHEQVLASAAYRKAAASAAPGPQDTRAQSTWATVFAPSDMVVFGEGSTSTASAVPMLGMLASGLRSAGAAMSGVSTSNELSSELGAASLAVRMVVNFVEMQSSDRSWISRSSGTASVAQAYALSIHPSSSLVLTRMEGGVASYSRLGLGAQLALPGPAFREIKDVSSLAANVGLAVLNLAIGKGNSSSVVEKEAVAEPEAFQQTVLAGLGQARAMFLQRMQAAAP
jgi:hypothetical protein